MGASEKGQCLWDPRLGLRGRTMGFTQPSSHRFKDFVYTYRIFREKNGYHVQVSAPVAVGGRGHPSPAPARRAEASSEQGAPCRASVAGRCRHWVWSRLCQGRRDPQPWLLGLCWRGGCRTWASAGSGGPGQGHQQVVRGRTHFPGLLRAEQVNLFAPFAFPPLAQEVVYKQCS